jgi:hypothetical protein
MKRPPHAGRTVTGGSGERRRPNARGRSWWGRSHRA